MKKIIFTLIISILFIGCATSSLNITKDKKAVLNYDSQQYLLSTQILSSKSLNFKDLLVDQYKLKSTNNNVLFYEHGSTALNFEFNFGGLYTVMCVFDDAQKYEQLYKRNNLRMVQIKLKDNRYVNVIIQASDTQNYTFVYGFSNDEFIRIYKKIRRKVGNS